MTSALPGLRYTGSKQSFTELTRNVSELLDEPELLARLEPLGIDFPAINSAAFMPEIKDHVASLPLSADSNGVALIPVRKEDTQCGLYIGEDLILPTPNRVGKMLMQAHSHSPEAYEELVEKSEQSVLFSFRMTETTFGSPLARMQTAIGHCMSPFIHQSPGIDVNTRPLVMIRPSDKMTEAETAMVQLHEYVHADDSENRAMSDPDAKKDDDKYRAYTELRAYFASEVILDYFDLLDLPNAARVKAMRDARIKLFNETIPTAPCEITAEQSATIISVLARQM